MPEEEQQATIRATVVETEEPTFKPPPFVGVPKDEPIPQAGTVVDTDLAVKQIFAVLEPEEVEQTTFYTPAYTDFYNSSVLPPFISYEKLPQFEARPRELIINIETTTANPWEGRVICIGVMDPNARAPDAMNFIQDSELATIDEFFAFFEQSPYTTLVGYNVSFDYRFLYAVLQKYRKESRKLLEMNLYDLMQQQKQVKHEFVFGFNRPGKLEEWSTYLFGSVPYAPQKQLFKWYEEGNVAEIVNFNSDKLAKAYGLWVLNKVVEGSIPGAEILARPSAQESTTATGQTEQTSGNPEETIPVQCPNCLQAQTMQKTAKVVNCVVCGKPIAHP